MPPTSYLEAIIDNDQFMLTGSTYTIKVNKNTYAEVYYDSELTYIIDFANLKSYYLNEDILYELNSYESFFNIVDFAVEVADENFTFDGLNKYNLNTMLKDFKVNFTIDIANNTINFSDEVFTEATYEIVVDEYKSVDLSVYDSALEEIINLDIFSYGIYVLSINALSLLEIMLEFNTEITKYYSYDDFINEYNGSYDDQVIYYYFFDELKEINLADYGISIYDEDFDQVVVFGNLNSFSYISDLVELPVAGDADYQLFEIWEKDFHYPINSVEDLNQYDDEVIFLNVRYKTPTINEFLPFLESKEFIEVQLNYRDYGDTNQSTSLRFTYSYADDWFVLIRNNKPVVVGFDGDEIFIKTYNQFVKYDKEVYTLKGTLDFLEIHNFSQTISDLILYRNLFLDKLVSYKVEDFFYYSDGLLKIRVEPYMERVAIIRQDISDYHFIFVGEEITEEIDFDLFDRTLAIYSRVADKPIIISGNSIYQHQNMQFIVEDYSFDDYYLYDEFGEVDYDQYFQPTEYTYLSIYANYFND